MVHDTQNLLQQAWFQNIEFIYVETHLRSQINTEKLVTKTNKSFSRFCCHLNNYKPQLSFYNNKSSHLNNYKPHLSFYANNARQKTKVSH